MTDKALRAALRQEIADAYIAGNKKGQEQGLTVARKVLEAVLEANSQRPLSAKMIMGVLDRAEEQILKQG